MSNAKKIYNVLYYIYKEKYKKEINSLDTNNKEWLDYKNLRLSEYLCSSEEEQEQKEQKPIKVDYKTFNKKIIDNKDEKVRDHCHINGNLGVVHIGIVT